MGSPLSTLRAPIASRPKVAAGAGAALLLYLLYARSSKKKTSGSTGAASKARKSAVDSKFYSRLKYILTSSCGWRELYTAIMLTGTLFARTFLSVYIANHLGITINYFCEQKWDLMAQEVLNFACVTIGGSILNASLKYYAAKLVLNIRQRLMHFVHALYMRKDPSGTGPMIYYKANKVGSDKFENADQLITDDVEKFCEISSEVFSNALKPLVDLLVFSFALAKAQGLQGPMGLYSWFFVATVISMNVLPPYGKLAAEKQRLEGKFRAAHAELIVNCEQVAFMGGEQPEKSVLNDCYKAIHEHELSSMWSKFKSNVVTGYVNKYFASVVGLFLISAPVYNNHNGMASLSPGDVAKYYVSISRIMAGLSDAVLDLFEMSNRVGKLAGLTQRVYLLISGLEHRKPVLTREIAKHTKAGNPPKFQNGTQLKFEGVSIYRPDGMLLVRDLNFTVNPGDRVIITGPNGCGKSSLFRVLRGLWPLVCGTITRPENSELYFLSQVNFVPLGTLRDLIIYPDSVEDMQRKGRTDDDLRTVLQWADLEYLQFDGKMPEMDDVRQWGVDLSPGQKQRVAFARLLYHRPKFAVLDECTNGISPDVEQRLYDHCRRLGMAVFSISHKIELKKLHDYELHYNHDDQGSYTWRECDTE